MLEICAYHALFKKVIDKKVWKLLNTTKADEEFNQKIRDFYKMVDGESKKLEVR